MQINNVNSISDGYCQLFNDMKLSNADLAESCNIIISSSTGSIVLENTQEFEKFFELLTQFSITPDNIQLIRLRYGLDNAKALTYKTLSEIYNVSDECIRSRIRQSFRKMKHRFNLQRVYRLWKGEEA